MRKRKSVRRCRCCGAALQPTRLWLCEECQAAGRTVPKKERVDTEELEAVARERQASGQNPLEGMSLDEVSALAWEYRSEGYGSYGKLRGYVYATGRMPERRT